MSKSNRKKEDINIKFDLMEIFRANGFREDLDDDAYVNADVVSSSQDESLASHCLEALDKAHRDSSLLS